MNALLVVGLLLPKLAVLELRDEASLEPGAVRYLAEVVRGEAVRLAPGHLFVLTRENLLAMLPPDVDLADCEGACEVETGRNIGADHLVTGTVVRLGDGLRVALKLHDMSSGALTGQTTVAGADAEALEEPLRGAAAELLKPLVPCVGTARLLVTPRDAAGRSLEATVHVDGAEVGTAPGAFEVSACSRELTLSRPGHPSWQTSLELVPGGGKDVDAVLDWTGAEPESGDLLGQLHLPYIAVALGAVGLIAGVTLARSNAELGAKLQQDPDNTQLRDDVNTTHDWAITSYAAGGVLATVGLGMLLFDFE